MKKIYMIAAVMLLAVAMPQVTKAQGLGVSNDKHQLSVSTNLLHWATITPDVGVEYRFDNRYAIVFHAASTFGTWELGDMRWGVNHFNPELRYYMGSERQWYAGFGFNFGAVNWYNPKNNIGRQTDFYTYCLTGGYVLKLNKNLFLDFNLGIGYDQYKNWEHYYKIGDDYFRDSKTDHSGKPYVGQLAVNLTWKL